MLLNKYDFSLTENNKNSDYWKEIAKNNSKIFKNTLLLPPPNITGNLHLGHALDSVTQDFLVRFSYLNKKPIYWIAGIDHAGISAQNKIESLKIPALDNDQKKREYTLETWYPQSRQKFFQQWEKLGLLIDYEKAVFSLDPIIQKQVKKAFIKLYHDGLIYRGEKLVNWDSKLKSVISDIEVENISGKSRLYYLKYELIKKTNPPILGRKNEKNNTFVRVIILNKEKQILLVKDKKWGWTLPGGKVEENETLEEAAKREVFEETNLTIEKRKLLLIGRETFFFNNQPWEGYFYRIDKYEGEIKIKEEEQGKMLEINFFNKESKEVNEYSQYFADKKEYQKLLNNESQYESKDYLLIATSRPETIFADVALFVNPDDKRYQKYIGKQVKHPWTKKIIPILADKSVKIDFGTGVLKCTPGHDQKDYELSKKYQLPVISCCDEKGILNELTDHYQGEEINNIRKNLVKELVKKHICEKIEDYETSLAYSTKSGALIEIILSQQWFLDLPSLIEKIEKIQPNFLKKIDFIPINFQKELEKWRNKTQEWCLSRQLWWGHQIPAWYHKKTGEIHVGEELCFCEKQEYKGKIFKHEHRSLSEWEPEKDVLDTWFSSGLWPIVTLITEEKNFPNKLPNSYPITTLITGYDILFFWVLKMIILGTYFTGQLPFKQILFHGLIRDEKGRKMSKSLDNGVEPEILIKKYGCDSLRLFLLENNIWGSDLVYQEEKIIGSWRFCQKIWSIANLITRKLEIEKLRKIVKGDLKENNNLINQWVFNKLKILQQDYFSHLEEKKWEINLIVNKLTKFVKETLSNDYLELIKISPWDKNTENTLLFVYQQLLIMLHPIIPFITEYIYQAITGTKILESEVEKISLEKENNEIWQIDCLLLLISKIRNIRKDNNINHFFLELMPEWEKEKKHLLDFNLFLEPLTKSKISFFEKAEKNNFESFVNFQPFGILWYQQNINIKELQEKLIFYEKECQRSEKLLKNNSFIKKAPTKLIEEEKKKLISYQKQKKELEEKLKNL